MAQLFMPRPNLKGLPKMPLLSDGRSLRPSNTDDIAELAALLEKAFPGKTDCWSPERVQRELVAEETVQTTWLIVEGTRPIATASSRLLPEKYPESGYVHWVAADPAFAGQRLGYAVTLAVLHEFIRFGCHDAILETQEFRIPAIKTYLKLGFHPEYQQPEDRQIWATALAPYPEISIPVRY